MRNQRQVQYVMYGLTWYQGFRNQTFDYTNSLHEMDIDVWWQFRSRLNGSWPLFASVDTRGITKGMRTEFIRILRLPIVLNSSRVTGCRG